MAPLVCSGVVVLRCPSLLFNLTLFLKKNNHQYPSVFVTWPTDLAQLSNTFC